jgi:hypothetical protein
MAVNDVYRISVMMATPQDPIINTFFYRVNVVGAGDPATNLDQGFDGGAGTLLPKLLACLPAAVTVKSILIQAVKPNGIVQQFAPFNVAGSVPGNYCPQQVAVVITRKTIQPGRGGRGRLFVGPVPVSQLVAADNNTVLLGNYTPLAAAMVANVVIAAWTFTPVLWKRKTATSVDLLGATANPLTKTRRSRGEGIRFHRRKRHTVGSI